MINPLEIQAVEFGKSLRGYQTGEVDKFIDDIFEDYEIIYKENKDLKERIVLLEDQIETYKSMEKTLNETLILASDTAETLKNNAAKEAEFINKKAEEEAKRIIEKANGEVMRVKREFDDAKKQVLIFNERYRNLLKSQIELLNKSTEDMFD
ncbi:MAG: septum formation initiator [Clostridiales bacterium]|nr:MAG: septum formation initiator [Clostridiales bacterium]